MFECKRKAVESYRQDQTQNFRCIAKKWVFIQMVYVLWEWKTNRTPKNPRNEKPRSSKCNEF